MQNRGAIIALAIILVVVCLYQLSFTFVSQKYEDQAIEFAAGDPDLKRQYLDSIANEPVYNLLVKNYTFNEVQSNELGLGLDLKGGMNVTLEVSVVDVIKSMANNSQDPTFLKALEDAKLAQQNSQLDFVTLFQQSFEAIDPNAELAAIFATLDLQDKVKIGDSNDDVINVIKQEADDAISRSFNILRTRIDKFGVTQPNIQQLGSGRILVELPGVKDPERVHKLLQGTAKLEFWETYTFGESVQYLIEINKALKDVVAREKLVNEQNDTSQVTPSPIEALKNAGDEVAEGTAVEDTSKEEGLDLLDALTNDSLAEDTSGISFDEFAAENPLFALLTPADYGIETVQDQEAVYALPRLGFAAVKDVPKINEYLSRPEIQGLMPRDMKFLWTVKPIGEKNNILELIAIKTTGRDGKARLEGDKISNAFQDFDQYSRSPEIRMQMNAEGAKEWKRMTGDNVGKAVAIVLDDYVYSYPTVQGEIAGGNSNITGNFTINEAKDLANILKAGKLPAPARIVEEAVVGPSLGAESIRSGFMSFIIALVLVLIYMIFYYNNAGIASDIALLANIFFIIGVLASVGATLTLPGIAGIVLTIGMSVDANILIFERIREEMAQGKGLRLAIADGYSAAYSAIIDANVTTFLTALVLFLFGSGPIQGFATTLMIGIITSLFSAIFITRLIFDSRLNKNKSIKFDTGLTKGAFKNLTIDWVSKRKIYYIISGIVIAIGISSIVTSGFNLGVDFQGGRTYVVRFDESKTGKVSTADVRAQLTAPLESAPEVKTFGPSNQVKITTTYLINSADLEADDIARKAIIDGLNIEDDQIMSSQKVGPTIADDIKVGAMKAVAAALVIIFLYILLRFRRWTYGAGAILALSHDVLVVLGIFSIFKGILPFSLEIDQAFIAAILTVMGYSINDTVVVFDRIREYLGIHHKKDMNTVINSALNSTISRTLNTSITIAVVLIAIVLFGGEVIRGFAFALLVGVLVGTYSSVCIATPVVVDFGAKALRSGTKK
ncbi:MAG: protein translocase subunit SecDF [Bacteroidia bacterium]|nr:protein translocase subunit SecDF [Bacteroidia bacterium]